MKIRRTIGAMLAAALLLAACGGDDEPAEADAAGDEAPDGAPSDNDDVLAAAVARVEELKAGTSTAVPTEGPAAVADKSVWIISCSQSIELCSDEVNEIEAAAKTIGWDTKVVNTEFDPVVAGDAIRQAVAAQADGIIVFGFDCPLISQPLQEAVDAGIETLGVVSLDCDDPALAEQTAPLFTVDMVFDSGGEIYYSNFALIYGRDKAAIAIAATEGQAKVMSLDVPDLVTIVALTDGFEEGMADCGGCEIVTTVDLTTLDQVNGTVEQKVTTALARNPEVDTVFQSTDGLFLAGVQNAILNSGRANDLLVIGSEGFLSNLDAIRAGNGQDIAMAFDSRWEGWASVDAMNRAFAGAEQVHGGQGYIYIDAETNMPESGGWDSTIDFREAFRQLWGV
jgi:ribose transport system substrate-binding protein